MVGDAYTKGVIAGLSITSRYIESKSVIHIALQYAFAHALCILHNIHIASNIACDS